MKIFSTLYTKVLGWAAHPMAERYLGGLSLAESSFFPIPPDIMLLPMTMAKPEKSWRYALITTVTSVIGGIIGYLIGKYLFVFIGDQIIGFYHAQEKFNQVKGLFDHYGIWIVFIAGFTPIPYKIFTITAGVLSMAFLPFVIASLIGRGGRFFLVAGLGKWFGPRYGEQLHKVIDIIGWITLVIIIILLILYATYK